MRFDRRRGRWLSLGLVAGIVFAFGASRGRAMEGAGGGESDPFAALRSEASANLFTGAAALAVPILLPPGRKLATPELALRYSSQGGLSSVGLGWSLGLGVLSRSVEHGTPVCDGPDPERFRLTLGGSSNELVRESDDRFLLAYDEGWAEAIPDRVANEWRVRTRDGLLYVFGGDPAARSFGGGDHFHDPQACALTTAWYVTRLEDPSGNQIEIDWESSGNSPLPRELRYGGNAAAGIPHPFRVRFESEALADAGKPSLRTLANGVDQRLLRRIRRIVVELRESREADFEELRRYELEYDDSLPSADFLLAAVSATDLPTRRFGYASASPTIVDDVSEPVPDPDTLGASFDHGPTLSLMDLNGDALLDRLCVDGNGVWHAAYGESGAVQFTGYDACSGAGNWDVPAIPGLTPLNRISRTVDGRDVYLTLDLDGDGLVDLVRRVPQTSTIEVYRGRCRSGWDCGFASPPERWSNPHPASERALRRVWSDEYGTRTLRDLVDMNGDGRPDLLAAEDDGSWRVHLNTGSDFESAPRLYAGMDTLLGYSPNNKKSAAEERQLIDVNDDGLIDWVVGVDHAAPREASWRIPELYYGVAPDGTTTGPFPRAGGPYLCPPTRVDAEVSLCTGGNALPAGWAIVGAATVRLNTGSGFSEPVPTPAPFWQGGDETANRLRASWTAEADRKTYTYRDFVDVNGDGRIDWVTSGFPYDGSERWYVLYNRGDGSFGGGLTILAPARDDAGGFSLGSVRPARSIGAVADYLGRTFRHTAPDDRVDRQLMVLDIDADGLPERVKAFGLGGGDRWEVKRLRFADASGAAARPNLLTRVEDGVGGVTHLRYAPSSRFVPEPGTVPRLPFVLWLLTGIRRTDGLCDVEPGDWFRLEENPCLAAGHELVQRFEYEEGAYDGHAREFLGFARTRVFEGPEEIGSAREIVFHQTPALRGKRASESLLVGGVELLSKTEFDWRTLEDGPRTQVYLQEQRIEEYVLDPQAGMSTAAGQCVVHRNSIRRADGSIDPWTRIQSTCSMACAGADGSDALCAPDPVGKKQVDTLWAEPAYGAVHPVFDRPAEIVARHVDATGSLVTTSRVRRYYDGLGAGLVDRGHLVLEQSAISEDPEAWAFTAYEIDGGDASGPGNVTAVHVPVAGEARMPSRVVFDAAFALHPIRESAWVSNGGAGAERRIESRFDLRHGQQTESVGLQGRAAGDVAGTVYDGLGRPVCEYAPGTSCGASSGFGASAEYRYVWGTPGASDPIERLSRVELMRREPNAPAGFVTTRTYFDAFGRERLTTRDQDVVDPASPGSRPALRTVVLRHLDHAPNGRPARLYAPYVVPASGLALAPPDGTPASESRYVLNGDASGRLDPLGRVHETVGFDGSRTRDEYYGRVHRRVEGIGTSGEGTSQTLELLDEHGRVVERHSLDGAGSRLAQWNAEYDGRDRVVAEWFGGLASTRITRVYDLLGRAISTDDPDAGRWRVRYDEAGNEVFRDDPREAQSIQSCYDGLNRVVLQCVRASDVPDPGLCAAAQPACTVAWRYRYDEAGPLFSTARAGLGRLTSVEGPELRQRWAYDVRGRVVLEAVEIRGEQAVTRYHHPADLDRLEAMTYPDGEIIRYHYDASGRPTGLTQVDSAGRLLASYIRDVVYDLFGRPLVIERGNGTTDQLDYHDGSGGFALGRLTTRGLDPAVLDPRALLVDLAYRDYDASGRLLRIEDLRDPTGALSMSAAYDYDAVGRLLAVDGPAPERFLYDGIGNLVSIDGERFERTGGVGQALGPHQWDRLGSAASVHWTFEFDENGRRKAKRRSDGSFVETCSYDAFGAMWSRTTNGIHTGMAYDHTGRRIFEISEGVVRRFFGRHAETVNGRLLKSYFLGDRLVAMRSDGPISPVAAAGPTSGGALASWPERFDARAGVGPLDAFANRLVAPPVRLAVLGAAGLLLLVPLGASRRTLGLRIARSGALGSGLLVFALALPVVVSSVGCSGPPSIRHLHLNHLGSPIAITGPVGTLERQYRYSAYGKVRRFDGFGRPSGSDPTNRREFGGYDVDERSRLQYAGSRYYDPLTASFLTPDPADEQANPYAFVGWDPINAVDPNGAAISLIAAILLAVSAVLVVAGAIVAGVRTGNVVIGLQTLGVGLAGLAAGFVVGLAAPAAATSGLISQTAAGAINASLSVASVGGSLYGLAASEDPATVVLAGAGLALALAGAAFAIGTLSRPQSATPTTAGSGSRGPGDASGAGEVVQVGRRSIIPRLARRLGLEAQRRLIQLAQQRALDKVQAGIDALRSQYAGRAGIDVYAEVLIEGPRIPHPTKLFAQHLLPNLVEVSPTVVPTGRPPTPTLLAPVPWDRFRIHEFIPVLRNGTPVPVR